MNADFVRLQNAFTSIESSTTTEEAAITIIQGKLANAVDPTAVASLATQFEGVEARQLAVVNNLTAMAENLSMVGGTSTATGTATASA